MRNDDKSTSEVPCDHACCCRREFLQTAGATAGALAFMSAGTVVAGNGGPTQPRVKKTPKVLGAFVYTPSEQLKKEGYWSWPGSSFDPEGHQRAYTAKVEQAASQLDVQIKLEPRPLADAATVSRFIDQVKRSRPDGLLLFFSKKYLSEHVERIVDETKIPAMVCLPLGTLLVQTIQQWQQRDALHLIDADQGFDAVLDGLRMIRTARWMKDARLININGTETREAVVPHLGTQVRTIPHAQFYEAFRATTISPEVQRLAHAYHSRAREVVEPNPKDIQEAARCYFSLKRILKDEHGDALMMDCLPGLKKPRKHVPPCMGFMSLHDEGIVAGCQSDLDASLTMMLGSQLPGSPDSSTIPPGTLPRTSISAPTAPARRRWWGRSRRRSLTSYGPTARPAGGAFRRFSSRKISR
ncbi:MAG: hypothetical protein K8R46_05600 [Pirellulales bacterium]|nr:hypothetical protein [Pirellulales bacterium]